MSAQASILSDRKTALEHYQENGFHIEYNALTAQECDALIAAGKDLENAKNGTFRPQMMPHRSDPRFLQALKIPKIKNIIEMLVGGTPAGLQTEFFFCKPGTRGFSMHQDNFYVEAPYGVFASAWIALTDTYKEKGGLIVYPGTHKEGQLATRKLSLPPDAGQDPNANNEETIIPEKYKPIYPSVPKGAALFIHGHLVHSSGANTTSEFRYVLLNTYIRAGEPFRPGRHAQRAEVAL